jgi:carbamoyl-phosphate synthase large subunit
MIPSSRGYIWIMPPMFVIKFPILRVDLIRFMKELPTSTVSKKIDMLIPTLDSELYGFVKLESRLNALGIKTFLPTLDQLNIRGKDKLLGFCKANGIHVPKNTLATSIQDLYSIPSDFTYPVVIKGIFYEAYIAHNFEEATGFFKKLANKWGYPIIIQEYIKGSEYNVVALGDGEGGMTGAVPMKKTLHYR